MANFNERLSLQWNDFKDNVREYAPFGEVENTSVVAKDQKSRCSEKGRKVCRNPDQLCLTVPPPGRAIKSEEANMQTQLHKYKNTNTQIQVYTQTKKSLFSEIWTNFVWQCRHPAPCRKVSGNKLIPILRQPKMVNSTLKGNCWLIQIQIKSKTKKRNLGRNNLILLRKSEEATNQVKEGVSTTHPCTEARFRFCIMS